MVSRRTVYQLLFSSSSLLQTPNPFPNHNYARHHALIAKPHPLAIPRLPPHTHRPIHSMALPPLNLPHILSSRIRDFRIHVARLPTRRHPIRFQSHASHRTRRHSRVLVRRPETAVRAPCDREACPARASSIKSEVLPNLTLLKPPFLLSHARRATGSVGII